MGNQRFYFIARFDLDAKLEEDLANIQISDSDEESQDHYSAVRPYSMKRFDSSACMILPNSYCTKAD